MISAFHTHYNDVNTTPGPRFIGITSQGDNTHVVQLSPFTLKNWLFNMLCLRLQN